MFLFRKIFKVFNLAMVIILVLVSCKPAMESNIKTSHLNRIQEGTQIKTQDIPTSMEKHFEISIGFWEIQRAFNEAQPDDFLLKIERDFNIHIKPVQVSWTNYKDKYLIMAASKQLPDISANVIVNSQVYFDWIDQGVIRSIPDDLTRYPHIQEIMDLTDVQNLKVDGRFYMIPRVSFLNSDYHASDAALLVRRDWMEKLGIKDPKNFDEFIAMLKAFVREDPDGNGVDDTIGLTVNTLDALGKWVLLNIYPEFNLYSWVKDGDKYVPSCAAENFPKALRELRKLYSEGILDPDFATQRVDSGTEKFARGEAGALEYKSSPSVLQRLCDLWNTYNPNDSFTDCVKLLHVFPARDGNLYRNTGLSYWSESYFSSNVSDDKMERILMLYDYLLSDVGQRDMKLGIESKDYVIHGEEIIITRPKNKENGKWVQINDLYPSIYLFGSLASWAGSSNQEFDINLINKANYDEQILRMAKEELEWNLRYAKPVPRAYEVFSLYSPAKSKFHSMVNISDDIAKVIMGNEDPEIMWQEVLERYKKAGMIDAIEEVNAIVRQKN